MVQLFTKHSKPSIIEIWDYQKKRMDIPVMYYD